MTHNTPTLENAVNACRQTLTVLQNTTNALVQLDVGPVTQLSVRALVHSLQEDMGAVKETLSELLQPSPHESHSQQDFETVLENAHALACHTRMTLTFIHLQNHLETGTPIPATVRLEPIEWPNIHENHAPNPLPERARSHLQRIQACHDLMQQLGVDGQKPQREVHWERISPALREWTERKRPFVQTLHLLLQDYPKHQWPEPFGETWWEVISQAITDIQTVLYAVLDHDAAAGNQTRPGNMNA